MFFETVDSTRMKRMEAMLKVLAAHFRGPFRVLELGTGPGPLTVQILRRFPGSTVVAVDTDPVLLHVGRKALHRFRRRITWVLADIRKEPWPSVLPRQRFDVIVSSLALHWLEEDEIRILYRAVGRLLRPGGLVVNGDFIPSGRPAQGVAIRAKVSNKHRGAEREPAGVREFKSRWKKWWGAIEREPSMKAAIRERQSRLPGRIPPRRTTGPRIPVSLESHERALRDAEFGETLVTWQDRSFRVLVARR